MSLLILIAFGIGYGFRWMQEKHKTKKAYGKKGTAK